MHCRGTRGDAKPVSKDELHPTSPTAQRAHAESALESAIAHLRRGLRRDGSYAGVSEWDVTTHQWHLLFQWAGAHGLGLPPDFLPAREGGREHDVRFDDASKRWIKFTKPSCAGYAVDVLDGSLIMSPASPLRYLERWKTHNHLFFDDVQLVGVQTESHIHRIVVSQQDWGDDTPTWEEIERAMVEEYRLKRLRTNDNLVKRMDWKKYRLLSTVTVRLRYFPHAATTKVPKTNPIHLPGVNGNAYLIDTEPAAKYYYVEDAFSQAGRYRIAKVPGVSAE